MKLYIFYVGQGGENRTALYHLLEAVLFLTFTDFKYLQREVSNFLVFLNNTIYYSAFFGTNN